MMKWNFWSPAHFLHFPFAAGIKKKRLKIRCQSNKTVYSKIISLSLSRVVVLTSAKSETMYLYLCV